MVAMRIFLSFLFCMFVLSATAGNPPHQKLVGTDWVWFTDYAFFRSEWTVSAEATCELEVGSGMSVGGEPRGSVRRFSAHINFTTWGIGAIHVRAVAGEAPCQVRVDMGQFELLSVFGDPSVVKGIIKDGKIVYDSIGGPKHQFNTER